MNIKTAQNALYIFAIIFAILGLYLRFAHITPQGYYIGKGSSVRFQYGTMPSWSLIILAMVFFWMAKNVAKWRDDETHKRNHKE